MILSIVHRIRTQQSDRMFVDYLDDSQIKPSDVGNRITEWRVWRSQLRVPDKTDNFPECRIVCAGTDTGLLAAP